MRGNGNCYEVAGKMISDMCGLPAYLCHGLVTGQDKVEGIRFGHAWIELNDIVIDNSNGKKVIMRKRRYYAIGEIKESEVKRYTPEQAKEMMLETGTFGPWKGSLVNDYL